jgi:predicted small metal-binding protein
MRQLSCKEAGGSQCEAIIQGNTDDEVMQKASEHATKEHGMKVTPEMAESLRKMIKNA